MFWVSRYLKLAFFNILHTCWTSHPFSGGRGLLILPVVMYVCENWALALGRTKLGLFKKLS